MQQFLSQLLDFESLFSVPSVDDFLLNTVILLIISQILSFTFQKFGETLSNRKKLSALFPLLAITTMMIISVIKSSIALSLGLVGALSIIRFRTAIKEPEELAYIFLSIALGLGMGAGERAVTLAFFSITILFLLGRAILRNKVQLPGIQSGEKLYLEIRSEKKLSLADLTKKITPHTTGVELKRMDTAHSKATYYFIVWVTVNTDITALTQSLEKLDSKIEISLLNEETLFS